ncbi:glycosyltransferase [Streptomyces sp. A5-4]|uniref:glycosyltransferase n=1 Tax=Streptomyces sp. A5-4 TaxID=3384771 RepID=UPI003DA9B176
MRVLVYSYGSRGDVQPYVALAHALNTQGHTAVLSAPARFGALASDYGIEFRARDDGLLRLYTEDPDVRKLIAGELSGGERKKDRLNAVEKLRQGFREYLPRLLEDTWLAAEDGADLVVHPYDDFELGHHVAEKLGVPSVLATFYPNFVPSRHYPSAAIKLGTELPQWLNRLSYLLLGRRQTESAEVDRWRQERLGLPLRQGRHDRLRRPDGGRVPVLHGFSKHLVAPAPDWPAHVHTTGFWHLPHRSDWSPPEHLSTFLASGAPPVLVGFGSIAGADPTETGRIVTRAAVIAGVRVVVASGWGSIQVDEASENVCVTGEVPYDWIFPRVAAAVLSGGTGSVHAALAAGTPQVNCTLQTEQFMWGTRAQQAGGGLAPVARDSLTPETLAALFARLTKDTKLARRTARLSESVRAEGGAEAAVRLLASFQQPVVKAT